jgi:hypothetical protein
MPSSVSDSADLTIHRDDNRPNNLQQYSLSFLWLVSLDAQVMASYAIVVGETFNLPQSGVDFE